MQIEERKVTVGEVCDGYFNDAEEGVVGYSAWTFVLVTSASSSTRTGSATR